MLAGLPLVPLLVIGWPAVAGAALFFEAVGDRSAGAVQVRSGQPRKDHGPGAVAVHPPPELLRRLLRLVGNLPDRLLFLG